MNVIIKHIILFFFSASLLIATLFVPMPAQNLSQMKKIEFGYPFSFISQDLSQYNSFSFFPRYQKFEFRKPEYINDFFISRFIFSLAAIFLFIEGIIYILELAKDRFFSHAKNQK